MMKWMLIRNVRFSKREKRVGRDLCTWRGEGESGRKREMGRGRGREMEERIRRHDDEDETGAKRSEVRS